MPNSSWNLTDLESIPQNGLKVMSTFACGGGSSMGYKRAGYEVIAANDIDPEMQWHYQRNLNPRHYFLCPIGDLLTRTDLPAELYDLDILDGSPPCSTFSMAGKREKGWGKLKHFREGQAEQVLSDLFFDYLNLVDKLRPKVAIAENVRGMLFGNAKGYTKLITERFREIGYRPQVFLFNAADCGVPQARERVFFCAIRDDIEAPKLVLRPNVDRISAAAATADLSPLTPDETAKTKATESMLRYWKEANPGEYFDTVRVRLGESLSHFSRCRLDGERPAPTLTAKCNGDLLHWESCRKLTMREIVRLGSFPDDYVFQKPNAGAYLIGMSVPPKMTEYVATQVATQWLNNGSRTQT